MTITRDATAPLPGTPTKNDIVSVAHILSDATECPFEHIHFSYIDYHGTQFTCSGFDFTRNFIDRKYQSVFVSARWQKGEGNINVTLAPSRYCSLHVAANHLTEAELTDLFAAIGEQLSDLLNDNLSVQPADKKSCEHGEKYIKKFLQSTPKLLLRFIKWAIITTVGAFLVAAINHFWAEFIA